MAAFPWAAAAGFAGDLIGTGLNLAFGDKGPSMGKQVRAQEKLQKYNWTRGPGYMVEGAKRAGLHPLTVLGANWSANSVMPVGDQSFQWGDAVGNGIKAAGQAAEDYRNSRLAESASDDARFMQILEQQRQLKLDDESSALNAANIRNLDAMTMEAQSRTALSAARARAIGGAGPTPLAGTSTVRNFLGQDIDISNRDSAQTFSDQYGDVLGEAYGLGNWFLDHFKKPWMKRVTPPPKKWKPVPGYRGSVAPG